jgi:hypothetical protein
MFEMTNLTKLLSLNVKILRIGLVFFLSCLNFLPHHLGFFFSGFIRKFFFAKKLYNEFGEI